MMALLGVLIAAGFLGALLYFGVILPAQGVASERRDDRRAHDKRGGDDG